MPKREFPRQPSIARGQPFRDAAGNNPFTDRTAETPTTDPNPFAPSAEAEARPYQPRGFEAQFADRSGRVLLGGVLALLLALAGLAASLASIVGTGSWHWGLIYCLPIQCVALAVALPAWHISGCDLKAMEAGAMSDAGLHRTRRGRRLGGAAVLLTLVPVVLLVVRFVTALASALS